MAEYEVPDPEDIMICPYNKAHAIRAKRMQVHLIKCRKQHEISREFAPCPFNAKHEVPKAELRYHLTICPDRVRLNEKFSHVDENTELKGCTDVPAYTPLNIRGENWDDDIPKYTTQKKHAGYLPNSQFLRVSTMNTPGLTAKQKRDLYLQSKEASQYNEEPKLRAPQKPSQAYSILLQQEKQKKEKQEMPPTDIYEFAFKKCAGGLGRGRGMVQSQQNTTSLGKTNVNLMSSSVTGTISNKNQESGGGKAAILTGVEDAACFRGTGTGDANNKGAWKPSSNFMASGVDRVSSVVPTAATGCSFPWSQALQRQAISLQNNASQPPALGGEKGFGTSLLLLQTTTSTSFDRDSRLDPQRSGLHMHHTEDRDMEPDEFSNTPAWVSGGYSDNRIGSWADEFPEDFPN